MELLTTLPGKVRFEDMGAVRVQRARGLHVCGVFNGQSRMAKGIFPWPFDLLGLTDLTIQSFNHFILSPIYFTGTRRSFPPM